MARRIRRRAGCVAADRIVIAGAILDNRTRSAFRRRPEGRDALGNLVGISPHRVDLRVDHLVHPDEVGPHDIPVNVLERQMKIVVSAQLLLQQFGKPRPLLVRQARNRELCHQSRVTRYLDR